MPKWQASLPGVQDNITSQKVINGAQRMNLDGDPNI